MAEDRSNQSLQLYKNYDNELVFVNGGEEGVGEVETYDVEPGTKVEKGSYLVSWMDDYTFVESEKVDVPAFEVPTTTTTTTEKPTTTTTTTEKPTTTTTTTEKPTTTSTTSTTTEKPTTTTTTTEKGSDTPFSSK